MMPTVIAEIVRVQRRLVALVTFVGLQLKSILIFYTFSKLEVLQSLILDRLATNLPGFELLGGNIHPHCLKLGLMCIQFLEYL